MGDLGGLTAARFLITVSGREDDIFPIDGAIATHNIIKSLYAAAGAEQRCAHIIGDGGHRFYADAAWKQIHKYLSEMKSLYRIILCVSIVLSDIR